MSEQSHGPYRDTMFRLPDGMEEQSNIEPTPVVATFENGYADAARQVTTGGLTELHQDVAAIAEPAEAAARHFEEVRGPIEVVGRAPVVRTIGNDPLAITVLNQGVVARPVEEDYDHAGHREADKTEGGLHDRAERAAARVLAMRRSAVNPIAAGYNDTDPDNGQESWAGFMAGERAA